MKLVEQHRADQKKLLYWTHHPLVDYGIATITVFSGKEAPEFVTSDDLEKFATYAEKAYFSKALSGYLTVLFTSNFINPSWKPEQKKDYVSQILWGFKKEPDPSLTKCIYCNRPSIRQPTSILAFRDLVPLVTGRGVINFFPNGKCGLPLCGFCTISIQALAIGAPMISGRALIIAADDPSLTLELTKQWLLENKQRIQISQATGEKPSNIGGVKTRVIEKLLKVDYKRVQVNTGITAYHFSNSGQGPTIDIYELPSTILNFLAIAKLPKYWQQWQAIINRAWQIDKNGEGRGRNFLLEDLFSLPAEASRFIRTYFLCRAPHWANKDDPRRSFRGWHDAAYIKWDITELFIKEVIGMEKERIDAIRQLGDKLADEIVQNNDKSFWWNLYRAENYKNVRAILIRQSQKRLKNNSEPLINLDSFLTIFEEGEELAKVDWRLAWDLVLIRLIEQLYLKKWFEKNQDVLENEETTNITLEV